VLINSAAGAASGELSVNHHGWQAADAVLFCPAGNLVPMHVVDLDVMLGTRQFLNRIDGFLTGWAAGAEDFDLVFHVFGSP